jgi:hypothetical protein
VDAARVFLTAEWRNLVLLNYEVDPALISPFVPWGVELDYWNSRVFLTLVGFQFLKTRVCGLAVPFHSNFDEVNLRFYVRRDAGGGETRRGVVFIKEIVPRPAITFVARKVYNENYVTLPMAHDISAANGGVNATYRWRHDGAWSELSLATQGGPEPLRESSLEQFIAEHFWGYSVQRDGGSVEYRVEHPSWRVWQAGEAEFRGKVEKLYGGEFAAVLRRKPASAFLAEGSAVRVMRGRRLS